MQQATDSSVARLAITDEALSEGRSFQQLKFSLCCARA